MEFGIRIPCYPSDTPQRVAEAARLAEDSGFNYVWMPDSHMILNEVFMSLSVAAFSTRRIKLGTAVCVPFTRHPTVLASATATLNLISGGRAVLGYGSGGSALSQIGLKPFASREQVRKNITIIKDLLCGKTVNFDGKENRLGNANGDIPIFLAACGPRMLQLAGEIADGVIMQVGIGDENLRFGLDNIRSGAERSGRSLEDLKIACFVYTEISSDRGATIKKFKPNCTFYYKISELLKAVGVQMDERITEIYSKPTTYPDTTHAKDWSQAITAASIVPDEVVEKFVLFGTADEITERIAQISKLGITQMFIRHHYSYSIPYKLIKAYSKQIMPHFRDDSH